MSSHRVVIAGGGVAGLEALVALRELAGDAVSITLLAPAREFTIRALSVTAPFAMPSPRVYDLEAICADQGATFLHDALASVDPTTRTVNTVSGEQLGYDSLLVAIGARPSPAFPGVTTFRGLQDAEAMHGLVQDVEGGYSRSVAFVVPTGTTWPLPIYELALMTAERAESVGMAPQITIVTPESAPLELFGSEASRRVDTTLAERGIVVRTDCHVRSIDDGVVTGTPGVVQVRAQRIVALPVLSGPRVKGLPSDPDGFLPVDGFGAVPDTPGVFGAGDGTTQPIKQGGVAAQQATAAARSIAAAAGAPVRPTSFRPVLRAELLTGSGSAYLRHALTGGDIAHSDVSAEAMWWPPTKVAAAHLAPYLARLDGEVASPR